jgi:hypothetical protein
MEDLYRSYLKLLRELGGTLEKLTPLAQQKAEAVRADDLLALDEVLKQEQAFTLNLRGLELRRTKLLAQMGLDKVRLIDLPGRYPPELQAEARKTVDNLRHTYEIYRGYADMARSTLELNLHQIDRILIKAGVDPKLAAEGYESPANMEPPKKMKTDFRA